MAVTTTVVMDEVNGQYVPFRGVDRREGPVGTYHSSGSVTGAAGGGSAKVLFDASFLMFGFHPLLVPRAVMARDNLGTSEPVLLGFGIGNERMKIEHFVVGRTVKTASSLNINTWPVDDVSLLIEPRAGSAVVMTFTWDTNTDTKVYVAAVFFVIYDLEALARAPGSMPVGVFLNS